ncbi:peptidase associated/transthyretin-like domain-containing protein [Tenacibaculum jejuense]|uniref:Uncharacterized protein n=1 Tax=Tenacibaculum jejuense TaxID=584609 RepID=A0A238UCF6_9FLAO|nr:carboxypeptidase-like regulatory domain-containing protein [Tenacibaculum jejuense]SNR16154.1 Protein of unknown function [Tenacibaculum jejuense]
MQKLLLYLIVFQTLLSYSQNKRIEISGTLSDSAGKVADAHIINTTSKQGTFSDETGNFTIPVKLGDELKITSIQHKEESLIVANVIIKRKRLDLVLFVKDYLLEEVEVKKTYLSGRLGTDTKHIKKSNKQVLMENLGFNPFPKKIPQIDREIYTASTSAGPIPLDLIINTISGRLKSLKKKRELLENEKRMIAVENKYKPMIISQLKIDSTEVSRFLYFCHFDKDFKEVYAKSEFEMIEFLQKQVKLFKKTKEK